MILRQVIVDFGTLTAKIAIGTFEHLLLMLRHCEGGSPKQSYELILRLLTGTARQRKCRREEHPPRNDEITTRLRNYWTNFFHADGFRYQLNDVADFDLAFVASGLDRVGVHDHVFGTGDDEELGLRV